jgi:Na+/H+ antiporter NhaD/arsenite permease-like protein
MYPIFASIIFAFGYLAISTEHRLKLSKSAIAGLMGVLLWIIVILSGAHHVEEKLLHAGSEIFEIVVFLLLAMSLVEILVHYNFFDLVRGRIYKLNLTEKQQYLVVATMVFILSGIIDNLTATIVMIQIARKFFMSRNIPVVAAGIVISANAGGAFSPIGDVTTIMLWLADKFDVIQIISQGFLPSLAIHLVALYFMYKQVKESTYDAKDQIVVKLSKSERTVVSLVFMSFTLPVVMHFIGLPPYMGLLLGLCTVWVAIDTFKLITVRRTHLEASIEHLIQKIDIASLQFFIGILLAVAALETLGILETLSEIVFTSDPSFSRVVAGNTILGAVSAVLDNVPLTAITIEILNTPDPSLWVLLAITVGTGGSMLLIGSVAGVIACGMVKELTFEKYLQVATIPALVSYLIGVAVWIAQHYVITTFF